MQEFEVRGGQFQSVHAVQRSMLPFFHLVLGSSFSLLTKRERVMQPSRCVCLCLTDCKQGSSESCVSEVLFDLLHNVLD